MKNEKILNLSKNKKTFQSIIETIIDNEKVIKIIENNYHLFYFPFFFFKYSNIITIYSIIRR